MRQAVTLDTNRIDLFTLKWLGSADDATQREFIKWNYDWFHYNQTYWLPLDRFFWLSTPVQDTGAALLLDGALLTFGAGHLKGYLYLENALLDEV